MALQQMRFKAGINRESTTLAGEGGWFECDKVRFRGGYPQKLGGWTPISANQYLGNARSLFNWITLQGYNLLAIGTNIKYYIEEGGSYNDVTPLRITTSAGAVTFSAVTSPSFSSVITVTDTGHGAIDGAYVTFSGAVSLGGNVTAAVLNQEYRITYLDGNTYSITVGVTSNSSDTGNGGSSVVGAYQLNPGETTSTFETGWGAGLWSGFVTNTSTNNLNGTLAQGASTVVVNSVSGFSTSGTLLIDSELMTYTGVSSGTDFTTVSRGQSGTADVSHTTGTRVYQADTFSGWGQTASATDIQQLRLWSEANYGENLIINPRGGALYLWVASYDASNNLTFDRAVILNNSSSGVYQTDTSCPTISSFVLVSDNSRFVIAFGVNDAGTSNQNPLLVQWSDQEDYQTWAPAITNQAGSFQLSRGSEIITANQTRQEILVWTDAALYSMQYLGPPYVWGFNLLADNISIISPNAVVTANNITAWMGVDKFYIYQGQAMTLPCSLRSYVFNDINLTQAGQVFGGSNEGFSEMWWFYCSAGSDTVNRYVIYNYVQQIWYYGNLARSAWLDSSLRTFPMAATYDSIIVNHENGSDDVSRTGAITAIDSFIQSSDFDIDQGEQFGFVWRMIPDITFNGSTTPAPNFPTAVFSMRPRQNPGANYGTGPTPSVVSSVSYANQKSYNVQQFTEIVYTRVRGRQMAFKVSSDTIGTQWQLGVPRLDIRPDGRR
jgi:hypothetical protein